MTTIIKAGSYCPVCRGVCGADCHHSMEPIRAAVTGSDYWQDRSVRAEASCDALEGLALELAEVVRLFKADCEDIPSEWLPVRAQCWVAMDKVNTSPVLAEIKARKSTHALS